MNERITFPELVRLVAESASTTQRVSELFLKELFATIQQALIEGEDVTIKGLGTFKKVTVASRRTADAQSGKAKDLPESSRVTFTPDKQLAATINMPFEAFETIILPDDISEEALARFDINPTATEQEMEQEQQESVQEKEPQQESEPTPDPTPTSVITLPQNPPTTPPAPEQKPDKTPPPFRPISPQPDTENLPIITPITHEPEFLPETSTNPIEPVHEPTPESYKEPMPEQNHGKAMFLKGLAAGVAAMLVVGAIGRALMSKSDNKSDNAQTATTITSKTTAPDSTSAETPAEPVAAKAAPVVTDTCTNTMFLSRIAQKHYGKADFWVYIYKENADRLADPNRVPPGTIVVIPPAEKYDIDPNDPESINRARQLSYELFAHK